MDKVEFKTRRQYLLFKQQFYLQNAVFIGFGTSFSRSNDIFKYFEALISAGLVAQEQIHWLQPSLIRRFLSKQFFGFTGRVICTPFLVLQRNELSLLLDKLNLVRDAIFIGFSFFNNLYYLDSNVSNIVKLSFDYINFNNVNRFFFFQWLSFGTFWINSIYKLIYAYLQSTYFWLSFWKV